jgi:hypothetical protein
MHRWRITKYDPRLRNDAGHYLGDDWIGAAQIGGVFSGTLLTEQEYLRVEHLYVTAALRLWAASGEPALQIKKLETSSPFGLPAQGEALSDVGFDGWFPVDDAFITTPQLVAAMVRWCLRDFGWCELVAGTFDITFGYDFYMFVGSNDALDAAREIVATSGLFVEDV